MSTERPPPGTPTKACATCGAYWLDYPDGVTAHRTVHGHTPRPIPPAPEEDTTDGS